MEYADEWDTQYTVNEGEEVSGIEIAYVDVTGEIKTVASVTVFIIIVMLFIAVIACILARIMAVKIENSQKAQKKFLKTYLMN